MLRHVPRLTLLVLVGPVLAGLLGTVLPAFLAEAKGLRNVLDWPGLPGALWLSVKTGIAATLLSLGITLAMIASLHGTRVFAAVQQMLSPLLAVPHAAAALGLAFLISPSGWIVRALSPWATGWQQPPDLLILNDPGGWSLIFGLVAKEVPFLLLMALAALPQTDATRRMIQAQSLGAGRVVAFAVGVLPSLYRQLRLPVYAVLTYSMTAVEMALILGPTLPPTLSAQITLWMADPDLSHRATAAAGALLQCLSVLAALLCWRLLEMLSLRTLVRWTVSGARGTGLDAPTRLVSMALGVGMALTLALGLLGHLVWSFAGLWQFPSTLPADVTLRTWSMAMPDLFGTGMATIGIAVAATAAAVALTIACLEAEARYGLQPGRTALWILYIPLIVPQIAFLPGLQAFALRSGLEGSTLAVAAIHVVFVLPYVFLSLGPAYRSWDARLALAAAALGASPRRVFWHLRLPMLLRAILTAAAVGLAVSIGQYLSTLLIGGGRVVTLTTEAVALSSGGNRRLIGAYALLQSLLPACGFALAILLPAIRFRNRRLMWATT